MATFFDSITEIDSTDVDNREPPPQKFINWLHGKVSTRRPEDIHHRIGYGPGDVAAGNHSHDGKDSPALFKLAELPNTLAPGATLPQVVTALNLVITALRTKGSD